MVDVDSVRFCFLFFCFLLVQVEPRPFSANTLCFPADCSKPSCIWCGFVCAFPQGRMGARPCVSQLAHGLSHARAAAAIVRYPRAVAFQVVALAPLPARCLAGPSLRHSPTTGTDTKTMRFAPARRPALTHCSLVCLGALWQRWCLEWAVAS